MDRGGWMVREEERVHEYAVENRYRWDGHEGNGVPQDKYWWDLNGEPQTLFDEDWLQWT